MRFPLLAAAAAALFSMLPAISPALAQDCSGWVPLSDPLRRTGAAMAYDPVREQILMFGGDMDSEDGSAADRRLSETWAFDGTRWNFVTLAGPIRRENAAMSFDSQRNVMVLFGGRASTTGTNTVLSNETWEFNGTTWSLVATGGPPARESHAMAFDPIRNQTVLFGSSSPLHLDIWLWNGSTWTQVQTPGPASISNIPMAWDPAREQVVLVSRDGTTWAWNGATWTQIAIDSPSPGFGSFFFDPASNGLVLFSSTDPPSYSVLTNDTWSARVQTPAMPLTIRVQLIFDPLRQQVVAFGGRNTSSQTADTTRTIAWPITPSTQWITPPVRVVHPGTDGVAATFDSGRGVTVYTGGIPSPRAITELRGDTWVSHGNTNPVQLAEGGLAYDPMRRVSVAQGSRYTASTVEWNGMGWVNRGNVGGVVGGRSSLCYDPTTRLIYSLWDSGFLSYDGVSWRSQSSPPSTPWKLTITFDPVRNAIVAAGDLRGNTFAFAQNAWSEIAPRNTSNRYFTGICYNPDLGGVLMFGGWNYPNSGLFPRQTYLLPSNGSTWQQLPGVAMIGRKNPTLVYDSLARRTLMFGGTFLMDALPDLWKLASGPAAIELQPNPVHTTPGHYVELFAVASGGGILNYLWHKDGVPLEDSPRWSGNRSDTLIIALVQPEDAGVYTLSVSNACGSDTTTPVLLTVGCLADWNADDTINTDDITAFFVDWDNGHADLDADSDSDSDDILAFFNLVNAGC